ncbi:MAG: D-alanyl-D-alanine carboxypeptidase [Treponema sp.]|jgi:D-alanyl-D-alanine carboxypeptidase (penicillin-binding protein 5/6)|nr:D-alanyl-D-alanine carboxypeptidase [Treponema sp.]
MKREKSRALLLLLLCAFSLAAQAPPNTPEIVSRAASLIDAETGTILYEKNPDDEIPPASLTKLMTMHIVFREIAAGRASLDETVPLSPESWAGNQPPGSSLMFLAPGQTVSLREILLGLAVSSGNDAAVAAALRFCPAVRDFAGIMNTEARRMGLAKTRFTEPSGISENNITTAGEFAVFCREYIRQHPESLSAYHSVPRFAYPLPSNVAAAYLNSPGTIVQRNRNTLLGNFPGVDGLKTGYIDESGYNIALTAEREGTRFIAVLLGAPSGPGGEAARDNDGRKLLSWAFEHFRTIRPSVKPFPARLWKGKSDWAYLVPAAALPFTAPAGRGDSLGYTAEITDPLIAPLPAGHPAGILVISDGRGELRRVPLVTREAYERGGFFKRTGDGVRMFFRPKAK